MGWKVHHMDVKTTFLNSTTDEEVYIEQALGIEVKDRETNVCRLKKRHFMASSKLLGHDDLLLTGNEERIQECKKILAAEFNMKDLGLMHYYLRLKVWHESNEIFLGQGKYVIELLKRFDMMECKPMTTPMITNLKMLRNSGSNSVDPTNCQACTEISLGNRPYYLKYEKGKDVPLEGFTDSNWGGNEKDGISTTGGRFSLGSFMVSWMSRKQEIVALSSAKAEYIAACEVIREAVWLRKMLSDLFIGPLDPTIIHCDNTSYIRLFEDLVFHGKTKHINNKYHYIRKLVQDGVLRLNYIPTDDQIADILTKFLPNKKLVYFRNKLGLVDISSLVERER
eukprot:PITA_33835